MNRHIDKVLARLLDIPLWFLNKALDAVIRYNNQQRVEKPCSRTSQGWCRTHRRWESGYE